VVPSDFPCRFGRYTLLSQMAVGGMAEILLAVEETEHAGRRFVTIKRIRSEYQTDPDYIEFFLTEGRVALKCAHPNLPQAFDLGVQDGIHYLAMEFISGHTLLDLVRQAAAGGTPVSVPMALAIGTSIAAALEYVHGLCDVDGRPLRVVHRDVTPQNIMISASGTIKLIDFGIVRSTVQTHRTQNGVVKGKFAYLAPETVIHRGRVDQRADLFSLGICLHETLTARPLFRGKSDSQTLERLRFLNVPDLSLLRPDVPPALAAAILKALERKPKRRFQSATQFLQSLEKVAERCGITRSVTRLRNETLDLCGPPPLPTLDRAAFDSLPQKTPRRAIAHGSTPPPPVGADTGDHRLSYFLSQAEAKSDSAPEPPLLPTLPGSRSELE